MDKTTRRTRKEKGEVFNAAPGDKVVVGFDVHKKTYNAGVRKNSELAATWVMPHDDKAVVKMLLPSRDVIQSVVYEAGPTGYGLARELQTAGLPVSVVAPGKTPQAANADNKSDRLDCKKLAEYEEKGLLRYVAIPTVQEDAQRAVIRQRDSLCNKKSSIKHQIKSFLLYHSIEAPEGLDTWSLGSLAKLRTIRLTFDLRATLDSLLNELDFYKGEISKVEKKISSIINKGHSALDNLLRTHPGVGPQTSHHFIMEIFSSERFENKRQVAAYVGLAPKINRSGGGYKSGGRLRGGRKKLRDCLIEASWRWIAKDEEARKIYNRLLKNSGEAKCAITAMARRMLVSLWTMSQTGECYHSPEPASHEQALKD
ncbi:MAG TPA: IS110 family transposase [Phycisphaerae bacterium]|nr:IS110 family transposase [Phycisphaerae bacterium]